MRLLLLSLLIAMPTCRGSTPPEPAPPADPSATTPPPDPVPVRTLRVPEADSPWPRGDIEPATDAESLFDHGDRLASGGRFGDALDAWRRALLLTLPALRELPFRHEVGAKLMGRSALREQIGAELKKEYPDALVAADDAAYTRFGFFEEPGRLGGTIASMLTEEIAGFYDPDTKRLYLIHEPKAHQPSLIDLVTGGDGFDEDEQKAVLAHEMTHALADQHFDLLSLQRAAKPDDDMALAVTALIEGEAMLTMMATAMGPDGGEALREVPPGVLGTIMDLVVPLAASFASGPTFRSAPLLLRESLMFPYLKGMTYALTRLQAGGWPAIDAAYRSPPLSTEQVLHPERGDDRPMQIAFADPAPLDGSDWELVKENTLGELMIEVLLRPLPGEPSARIAAGWDGDRFRMYRRKVDPDDSVLVWATTWDTEDDAREFEGAVPRIFPDGPGRSRVWRKGREVHVIDAAPKDLLDALVAWMDRVRHTPKRLAITTVAPKVPFPSK